MGVLPELPSWVDFPRTAWFVIEGVVLAMAGLALILVGPRFDRSVVTLGQLAILVGLFTAALGAVIYGLLLLRARSS